MIPYLPNPFIFDKLATFLKFTFTECDIKEVRPFLFIGNEFSPNYGTNGIYNTIPLLTRYSKRELFDDEFSRMIRLTLITCNYIHDYCSFYHIDLTCVKTPDEFKEISPDCHQQILKLFENEISELLAKYTDYRNSAHNTELDENSCIGTMMINAIKVIHKEETGIEISMDETIRMIKKK